MVYNEKYNRWCDTTGKIYRQTNDGKFIECKQSKNTFGYSIIRVVKPKDKIVCSHRLIWETFNGEIPEGYEIDHINTVREDNRLDNLRCVTRSQNMLNPITNKNTIDSSFGKKYFEHFGYSESENKKQYKKEYAWYCRHNKTCRWEVK